MSVVLEYGASGRWEWSPPSSATIVCHSGPAEAVQVGPTLIDALAEPLDFPPLSTALVPGDRVVLALDRRVPESAAIVAALWRALEGVGIAPSEVCILQPASMTHAELPDPRQMLPATVRTDVRWHAHDATSDDASGYLASSAAGERIYLNRELLDADFVLPINAAAFDPLLGFRGPGAVFYPGLSTSAAFAKTLGQGHSELCPDDDRPLRQLVEEIVWLLGVQFAIQVIPHRQASAAGGVIAGSVEAVERNARRQLNREWRLARPERSDTVVAAVSSSDGPTRWDDVGAAIAAAQKLVTRGGKIVLLTDLAEAPGPGMELLRTQKSARTGLRELRTKMPPDWLAASQVAAAADWASVYLLSGLTNDIVEELFLTPLASETESRRLLDHATDCVLLTGAQHTYTEIMG
jgi:nickel-dependent lactate racemase